MKIGEKLRKIRFERGLKQDSMAELLGISQATYNKMERNVHEVNSEKLKNFAEKLEINKEDLMEIDEKYTLNNHGTAQDQSFSVYNNTFSEKLEQLYKDKIALLEDKIKWLEAENERVRNDFQNLSGMK